MGEWRRWLWWWPVGGGGIYRSAMVNVSSMAAARRRVRKSQERVSEQRARRERDNVEDMATFLVARDRMVGVDAWEAERVAQVAAEAARRRDEQRQAAAEALARMRSRGETVPAIAALAETTEAQVRAYLKLVGASGAGGEHSAPASHMERVGGGS